MPRARGVLPFRRLRFVVPRLRPERLAARLRTISANFFRAASCAGVGFERRRVFFMTFLDFSDLAARNFRENADFSALVSVRARFWRCLGVSPRITDFADRARW